MGELERKAKLDKRDSNIELLRIVAMFLIVVHHYIVHSGAENLNLNGNNAFVYFFLPGGKLGVNIFVIISSWFMLDTVFSSKRIIRIWIETFFYSIVIWTVCKLLHIGNSSVSILVKSLFPVNGELNWYVTTFIGYLCLVPYLQILVNNLGEKQYRSLVAVLSIMMCILPTVTFKNIFVNEITWFSYLFLMTGFLKTECHELPRKRNAWMVIGIVSFCLIVGSEFATSMLSKRVSFLAPYTTYWAEKMNTAMLTLLAYSLFFIFINMKMGFSPMINKIASSTFGVFLIHTAAPIKRAWLWKVLGCENYFYSRYFVFHMLTCSIFVFICCSIIEIGRQKLFAVIGVYNWKIIKKITVFWDKAMGV